MKMNALYIKEKEEQFKYDLDYEEYLKYNTKEPSSIELDDMEFTLANPERNIDAICNNCHISNM